jgi:hypothetical protein
MQAVNSARFDLAFRVLRRAEQNFLGFVIGDRFAHVNE